MLLLGSMVFIIGIIWLLPGEKQYTQRVIVNCTPTAATRVMSDVTQWSKWWPGEIKNDTVLAFKEKNIKIQTILLNGFYANYFSSKMNAYIDVQFLSAPKKQSEFIYSYTLYYSSNPIKKVLQLLFHTSSTRKDLDAFIAQIKSNLEDVKKIYGFEITEERVPDAIHISTKKIFDHYPTTDDIYASIDELNTYIADNKAHSVNAPIYNIFTPDDKAYQLMVAIATDRPLPTNHTFLFKEMVRGKIIIGKSIGPNSAINQCLKQVEYFVKDHGRSSPAIQFNRLITDRKKELDSTKWITTINYPVFDRSFF